MIPYGILPTVTVIKFSAVSICTYSDETAFDVSKYKCISIYKIHGWNLMMKLSTAGGFVMTSINIISPTIVGDTIVGAPEVNQYELQLVWIEQ